MRALARVEKSGMCVDVDTCKKCVYLWVIACEDECRMCVCVDTCQECAKVWTCVKNACMCECVRA